jgi:hypothetical protein
VRLTVADVIDLTVADRTITYIRLASHVGLDTIASCSPSAAHWFGRLSRVCSPAAAISAIKYIAISQL